MIKYVQDKTSYHYFPTKVNELRCHREHLQQTISGYGTKLVTELMVKLDNRWYRVYYSTCSNCGSHYIIVRGKTTIIDVEYDNNDQRICYIYKKSKWYNNIKEFVEN